MADDSGFEKIEAGSDVGFEKSEPRSTMQGMAEGFMDPLVGAAQVAEHVTPKPIARGVNELNNLIAQKTGLTKELPVENATDVYAQQRETAIAKERGPQAGQMDWPRLAGNLLNPINYIGGALGPELKAGATAGERLLIGMEKAEIGGATAGAVEPATKGGYWTEKAAQVGVGALAGAATGGVMHVFGDMIAKNWPESLTSRAVQKILKRMKSDEAAGGPTATQAINLINTAKKPVTLADVGGENVQALAGQVARAPGEGRATAQQFMRQRDNEAAQRLDADIARNIHGGETMQQAATGLIQSRSAASRPVYEEAHALQNVWSPRLKQFLDSPDVKKGLARGYEIERLRALAEDRPITATQLGVDLDTEGNIKMVKAPNMRLLDMAKQGLDAMIADTRNEFTGRLSQYGVALNQMRGAFVKEMDSLDPSGAYKKARDTWAGYSASMDALKLGHSVFTSNPEEFAAEAAQLSPANLEFLRIGVADRLREKLAKTGLHGDESKALIKNSWVRKQLRPAFKSDQEFDAFADAVSQETQMFETGRKLLGGSQTAERFAEDTAPENPYTSALQKAMTGQPIAALSDAYKIWRQIGFKPDPELNAKIAKILFATKVEPDIGVLLRQGPRPNPTAQAIRGAASGAGAAAAPVAAVDLNKTLPLQ